MKSTVNSLYHLICSLITSQNVYRYEVTLFKISLCYGEFHIVTFRHFVAEPVTRLADSYSVLDAIRRAGPILLNRRGRLLPVRGPNPRRERHRPSYDVLGRFLVTLHQDVGDGAFDIRWRGGRGPLRRTSARRQCAVVQSTAVQRAAVESL